MEFKYILFCEVPFCRFMHSLCERENIPMWRKCVGHALGGHVTSFLWKWKLYDFAFKKRLVGHILNKIIVIVIIVFQTRTIFLKIMSKFVAGHVTKMWFLKLWIVWFQKLSIPSPQKGFFPRPPPPLSKFQSSFTHLLTFLDLWEPPNPRNFQSLLWGQDSF